MGEAKHVNVLQNNYCGRHNQCDNYQPSEIINLLTASEFILETVVCVRCLFIRLSAFIQDALLFILDALTHSGHPQTKLPSLWLITNSPSFCKTRKLC